MANSPSKTKKSSVQKTNERFEEAILELLAKGYRPPEIARLKYPHDEVKRKRLRHKVWRMIRSDATFQARIAERTKGEVLLGLIPAGRGLAKRASRKTDAAKLMFEMTGVHNPRVKHEHSGDVSITLNLPRPSFGHDDTHTEDGAKLIDD